MDEINKTARRLLEELEAMHAKNKSKDKPESAQVERLPLDKISLLPELFQPRGIGKGLDDQHVETLARAIRHSEAKTPFPPLLVLRVGKQNYLVDGHHRYEAHKRMTPAAAVPVKFFIGTPQQAVIASGKSNTPARLQMTAQQRMDYAWRLVKMECYSREETRRAASVSPRTVNYMRSVLNELGADAQEYESWFRAREAAAGRGGGRRDMDPEQVQEWLEQESLRWADKFAKALGTKMANNPELAAMALHKHLGRKAGDVARYLQGILGDEIEGASEGDDF